MNKKRNILIIIGVILIFLSILSFSYYKIQKNKQENIFTSREEDVKSEVNNNVPDDEVVKSENSILDDEVKKDTYCKNKYIISENSNFDDRIKMINFIETDDKIIQEYEVLLNGKKNSLKVVFQMTEEEITGKFNDTYFYGNMYYEDVDSKCFGRGYAFNKFNEKNFEIIKGEDNKDYLVVTAFSQYPTGDSSSLIIYNDDLIKIDSIERAFTQTLILENDINVWYGNEFDNNEYDTPQIKTKIANGKIYNLYFDFNSDYYLTIDEDAYGDYGTLEEREYTINNDKLEYKVINKYKIISVVGAI